MSLDKSEGMAGDDQKLNRASLEKAPTLDKSELWHFQRNSDRNLKNITLPRSS